MDQSTAPITDTLEFVEELEKVGMEREQARVVARGINGTLITHFATKADAVRAEGKISQVEGKVAQVEGKVAEAKSELSGKVSGVEGKVAEVKGEVAGLKGEVAELRSRLETIEARLLWRFLGGALVVSTLTAALTKFL